MMWKLLSENSGTRGAFGLPQRREFASASPRASASGRNRRALIVSRAIGRIRRVRGCDAAVIVHQARRRHLHRGAVRLLVDDEPGARCRGKRKRVGQRQRPVAVACAGRGSSAVSAPVAAWV